MNEPRRILICGDRHWSDLHAIMRPMDDLAPHSIIIEGGAPGADSLAKESAEFYGLQVEEYPADWNRFGRAAGPLRNQRMLTEGKPDEVWAFYPDVALGKGTGDMIARALAAGIPVKRFMAPIAVFNQKRRERESARPILSRGIVDRSAEAEWQSSFNAADSGGD